MRYVWIWILLVIDVIWLISSIVDIVKTIRFVKNDRLYDSVDDLLNCIIGNLNSSTLLFIGLHVFVLFAVSFVKWVTFKLGGAK